MADYSSMSDADLMAMVQPKASTDYSKLSDADLLKMVQPKSSGVMDFVKSIPRGVLQGAGNVASMVSRAGDPDMAAAMAWSGQDPVAALQAGGEATDKAVASGIDAAHEKTGAFPVPEGRAGKFGAAIGEGLGNPLTYLGPGGPALKLGGSVLSSLGSEAAGQATEGTKFETPARLAGGLAGGAAAVKTLGNAVEKAAIPTAAELKAAASSGYDKAIASGLELHPAGVSSFASKVEQDLVNNHAHTGGQYGTAPKTLDVLETLQNPPAGATITAANLDTIRKNLGRIARETNEGKPTPDAHAASVALTHLKDYSESLPASHVVAGDIGAYNDAIKQANGDYASAMRAESIGARLNKAENQASRARGVGFDDTIRTKLAPILDNKKQQRGFTSGEIAQIQKIHDGTLPTNVAKELGKFGVKGALSLALHTGAAIGTGGMTVPIAIGGTVARKVADALSRRQAGKLDDMLRMRSPEYEARASRVPPTDRSGNKAALVRALLAH